MKDKAGVMRDIFDLAKVNCLGWQLTAISDNKNLYETVISVMAT